VSTAHRRAIAGSSRALDQHGATVEMGIILALSGNTRKDFSRLLHELAPVGQSSLAAALVSLSSEGWLLRNSANGNYELSARGLDMIDASQRQRGRQARRQAA
jgi:hypothetical protein